MAKYTITPWRSPADLLHVRQQLYNRSADGEDQRRHAVDRVMAWKLRGNLPHAVESTALLIDAMLHHDLGINSSFSIRAVYSAAFTRFVTGFCDIGRHKERSLEPSSMLNIARQIDMPAAFVALRHEATHEELPSIQRLVSATREALDWLWRVYWSRLEEPIDHTNSATFMEVARTVLRKFRGSRREALRAGDKRGLEIEEAKNACVEILEQGLSAAEALAKVLVEDKLIVPVDRQLGDDLGGAFLMWDSLLRKLGNMSTFFLQSLVEHMIAAMTACTTSEVPSDVVREAFCIWVHHICQGGGSSRKVGVSKLDVREYAMKLCCANPGFWTNRLGDELLASGPEGFRDAWRSILDASKLQNANAEEHAQSVSEVTIAEGGSFLDAPVTDNAAVSHALETQGACEVDTGDGSDGWIRGSLPPTTPIGVAF